MFTKVDTNKQRLRRHKRVRAKISGTAARPRLNVFRSNANIYAQIIDDVDLAYVGTTDDYNKILGKDTSVESILLHDGTALTTIPNVAAAE